MEKTKKIKGIPMNFNLDAQTAHELKQFCLNNGPEKGKSLKISDFIAQAIREKLDRQ